MLVGHNPTLSQLASRLAGPGRVPLCMGKAAVCWFVCPDGGDLEAAELESMMTPAQLDNP